MELRRNLTKMINRIVALSAIVMVIASSMAFQSKAATISNFTIRVTYGQTEARSQLAMINKFRASSENWYWNSDDATKSTGYTSALYYDYDLEKVAMLRAAEIAYYYSHTRPNGDTCWGAYTDAGYGRYGSAENIAYGYSSSEAVFTAWKEDNYGYSGQGHRRNMLGGYQAFAVGHVVYNGRHYWVQEFSTRTQNTFSDTALDSAKDVTLTVSDAITPNAGVVPAGTQPTQAPSSGSLCANNQHSFVYGKAQVLEQTASSHKVKYDVTCKNCCYSGWEMHTGSHDSYPGKPCSVCGYVEKTSSSCANGHTYKFISSSASQYSSSTHAVKSVYKCSVCGTSYTTTSYAAHTGSPCSACGYKVAVVAGWQQNANGYWYQNADGTYPKNCWKQIDGKQYHFNVNGYVDTNKWISNTYWVKSNGQMATNEWVDGGKYYVGADGKWDPTKTKVVAGWKETASGYWYQNANGTYPANKWQEIDGKWYHFDKNGYMESNKWIGNYWLLSNGQMATSQWVDGDKYYVGADGAWDSSKKKIVTGWKSDNVGKWYVNSNGSYPVSKWQQIDGDWYHFDSRGYMESNKWIGNYWLLSNGKMATSQWVDNNRYYVGSDGAWVPGKK